MIDFKDLKHRLYSENKVEKLLEALGCEHIDVEQQGNLMTAQLPLRYDSNNLRAVQVVLNENLSANIRNRGDFNNGGDILSLVSYLEFDARDEEINTGANLKKAVSYICSVMKWDSNGGQKFERKEDYASPLKNILKMINKTKIDKPNPPIPESTLDRFDDLTPYVWYEEGLDIETMEHFQIMVDRYSNRITIPIRDKFGRLVGTKGRLYWDKDVTSYSPKYIYLDKCNATKELFNFHEAKQYIEESKRVFVFEGEKSVMKMWQYGYKNAVSFGSSSISREHALLIKSCGSDVEIVLCYDKDKTLDDVKKASEVFTDHDIYVIYDNQDLLDKKDSPVDKGKEVFEQLIEESVFYIS